jgi:serine/threonine protein kinase
MKLEAGGFGTVYETELPLNRRRVVMKVVNLRQFHRGSIWMARAEVEALQRIRSGEHCPHLVDQPRDLHSSEVLWWCRENMSVYMLYVSNLRECRHPLTTLDYTGAVPIRPFHLSRTPSC